MVPLAYAWDLLWGHITLSYVQRKTKSGAKKIEGGGHKRFLEMDRSRIVNYSASLRPLFLFLWYQKQEGTFLFPFFASLFARGQDAKCEKLRRWRRDIALSTQPARLMQIFGYKRFPRSSAIFPNHPPLNVRGDIREAWVNNCKKRREKRRKRRMEEEE